MSITINDFTKEELMSAIIKWCYEMAYDESSNVFQIAKSLESGSWLEFFKEQIKNER